jgi:hypothetical protein
MRLFLKMKALGQRREQRLVLFVRGLRCAVPQAPRRTIASGGTLLEAARGMTPWSQGEAREGEAESEANVKAKLYRLV